MNRNSGDFRSPLLVDGAGKIVRNGKWFQEPFSFVFRPAHKMKPQTQFLIIVGLLMLVLGGAFYVYSRQTQEPLPVFAATIKRDCAPWDGTAFTISIPVEARVIAISIYQSPDIKFPERFVFPDPTGRDGNALLLLPVDVPEALSGRVTFQGVTQDSPVEGEFDLHTETGRQFKGKFVAGWDYQPVMCG